MKFFGTVTLFVCFVLALAVMHAHAQPFPNAPTLQQVYGWGGRQDPPFLPYAYAPIAPPPVEVLPPPPPPPLGWIYGPLTACADPPACQNIFVRVYADGANVRSAPNGFVTMSLANGVPIIPLGQQGKWILIAPGCALAPTYTWSVTAGVPLSVCM